MQDSSQALLVRRLTVQLKMGFDKHWNGGSVFRTAMANSFSMIFPSLEKVAMRSVKDASKRLGKSSTDKELLEVIHGFLGQESMHTYFHNQFNQVLAEQGFSNSLESRVMKQLDWLHHFVVKCGGDGLLHELSLTIALEHYSTVLGEIIIQRIDEVDSWFWGMTDPVKSLWFWHCAEESEHKSVAIDLYRRLGGSETRRIVTFILASFYLWGNIFIQTWKNLMAEKALLKPAIVGDAIKYLLFKKGIIPSIFPAVLAFMRPGFHPTQIGDSEPARKWLTAALKAQRIEVFR